jgi:NAD(P)-dependent dehydrogenase (short-subunit alcohol dehydrogenase family)
MKTVLITGASSGYGLETARHFHAEGWRVVATMRTPRPELFPASDRMTILPLDVTDPESIAACVAAAGPVDVLVNNAGVGLAGILEGTPMGEIRRIFETNTFGVMAMIQAVLPGMRALGAGAIVNVTSSATLAPFPLAAGYTASKAAIEGLSGSLALELAGFGIRVKLVEPGYGPDTGFSRAVGVPIAEMIPADYAGFAGPILGRFSTRPELFTTPADVAETVLRAAEDDGANMRFPAGPDAVALWEANGRLSPRSPMLQSALADQGYSITSATMPAVGRS